MTPLTEWVQIRSIHIEEMRVVCARLNAEIAKIETVLRDGATSLSEDSSLQLQLQLLKRIRDGAH